MAVDNPQAVADGLVEIHLEPATSCDHSRCSDQTGSDNGALTVTITTMRDDHKPALVQIMQASFGDLDEEWTLERLNKIIEEGPMTGLVAVHNDEVVGLLLYLEWGGAVYLAEMATKPGWRSRGIGNQLMRFLCGRCSAEDWDGIWLHVYTTNLRAQAFYERHGFEVFGHQPNAYGEGAGKDATIMIYGQRFWQDVHARREVYDDLWKCA